MTDKAWRCICTAPRWLYKANSPAVTRALRNTAKGAAVTYLIVGLDRNTLARWHENVLARDIATATRIAQARAAAQGLKLVVAAVVGPNSCVLTGPAEERVAVSKAA